jgi:two-component system sensor histidine kinase MprB
MSFRRRITLVSAAAVAVAVVLASGLTYLLTYHQLRGQVDSQLRSRAGDLRFIAAPGRKLPQHLRLKATRPPPASPRFPLNRLPSHPNEVRGYQQMIDSTGRVLFRSASNVTLPVDARTRALAAHGGHPSFRDADVKGIHLRILAEPVASKRVIQFAQPLTDVDHLLSRLRLILVLLDIGGIALAALLGRLVTGTAVAPVRRLARAIEHVTRTQDLSSRIQPGGDDEIGRMAVSFNAMLDTLQGSMNALDASVHAQRQLVADASHELRTPITSLRTNIEILQQAEDMDAGERQSLLHDVVAQIEELTLLMSDLIDLARGDEPSRDSEDVRLDLVVGEAIERARRHSPGSSFHAELDPTLMLGVPARLDRAVNNLVDNAVKYSPPEQPVEIVLHDGELTVRDHGPGISEEDLPHVFDRFYRGAEARGRPGSGLGLAIVRQVAEQHGGSITAEAAAGGGTLMRLSLPGAEPAGPELAGADTVVGVEGPREVGGVTANQPRHLSDRGVRSA